MSSSSVNTGSFILTTNFLLRYISFIYAVAYLVALWQNEALLGSKGLLPAALYMKRVHHHVVTNMDPSSGSLLKAWRLWEACPTLLWFMSWEDSVDKGLQAISTSGLALAAFVLLTGCANMPLMIVQWLLYHSIVNVGQRWYSFGWESQLLETGFLAIFLCPFLQVKKYSRPAPSSFVVIMLFRWLIFRIMIGAGLIKIRGDRCWQDLTCMHYHYETQPVPNPLSYYLHYYPPLVHKLETLGNHIIELIFPWFLLLPRSFAIAGGIAQIFFQIMIIISGNLSFLNWLTIAPSIACFDDAFLLKWLPMGSKLRESYRQEILKVEEAEDNVQQHLPPLPDVKADAGKVAANQSDKPPAKSTRSSKRRTHSMVFHHASPRQSRVSATSSSVHGLTHLALSTLLLTLTLWQSYFVVENLCSPSQKMNHYYHPMRLLNTYGSLGSITKIRHEVILLGTHADDPNTDTNWLEYEFKCKPGNVTRRPCLISPYHYRLDWLMWFAAFQSYEQNPWLIHLMAKLLKNDALASSLLDDNPFQNSSPPKWIRADLYRYKFTSWKTNGSDIEKAWWQRQRVKLYVPPVNLKGLQPFLQHFGWPNEK